MANADDSAWFRRKWLIGYEPLTQEGTVTLWIVAGAFISFALLSIWVENTALEWVFGGLAAVSGIVGHAVIYWKMEDKF